MKTSKDNILTSLDHINHKYLVEVSDPVEFRKNWAPEDFTLVQHQILKLFSNRTVSDHNGKVSHIKNYFDVSMFLGLPYTSTGDYAGLWNTNTMFYVDSEKVYNIDGFALDLDNNVYIIASDKEGNEILVRIDIH